MADLLAGPTHNPSKLSEGVKVPEGSAGFRHRRLPSGQLPVGAVKLGGKDRPLLRNIG
jgi:hypothetical protein